MPFDLIAHALITLTVVVQFFRGPKHLLYTAAFLIPLDGLSIRIGVNWTWSRLVPFVLIAGAIYYRKRTNALTDLPGVGAMLVLGLFAIAMTLITAVGDVDMSLMAFRGAQLGWGAGQSHYRHVVQITSYLLFFGLLVGFFLLVRTEADFEATLKGLVTANICSVMFGIYQSIATTSGLPWFSTTGPMAQRLAGSLGVREALESYNLGPLHVSRLFGLSGEPKETAASMVLCIALVLVQARTADKTRPFPAWTLALFMLGLALTFSTSGIVALGTMITLLLLLGTHIARRAGSRGYVRTMQLYVAAALTLSTVALTASPEQRTALLEERVTDRLSQGTDHAVRHTPGDRALYQYLNDNPSRSILGLGLGGGGLATFDYSPAALKRRGPTAPTLFVNRILADIGFVGLMLSLLLFSTWLRHLRRVPTTFGYGFALVAGLTLIIQINAVATQFVTLMGAFLARSLIPDTAPPPAEPPTA